MITLVFFLEELSAKARLALCAEAGEDAPTLWCALPVGSLKAGIWVI